MNPAAINLKKKFYRKTLRGLNTTVDLDDQTDRVFASIDGDTPLSMVAGLAGVSIPALWKSVAKLSKLELIEDATGHTGYMGKQFADKLDRALTHAVGPMSNVLIKNVSQLMKISWPHIPTKRARELVFRIVVQIPNDEARDAFHQIMMQEL